MHKFFAFWKVHDAAGAETAVAGTGNSANTSNPFAWTTLLSIENSPMSIACWLLKRGR